MDHDTTHHDRTVGARDFSDAVPRGPILRNAEPVVAPVAATPAYDNDASTYRSDLDATRGTVAGDVASRPVDDPADPAPRTRAYTTTGVPARRFSLGATFLGWAVASFFSLVFTALLLLALGGAAAGDATDGGGVTAGDFTSLGAAGFVGLLVATFLAYLIGGYAAGRIAHFDGAKHGAIVPAWTILFGLLAILAGAAFGAQLANYVSLPYVAGIDWGAMTTYGILGILGLLLVAFAGAILGGILGARQDQRHEGAVVERRRAFRGRPL